MSLNPCRKMPTLQMTSENTKIEKIKKLERKIMKIKTKQKKKDET